jgi:uncharacterized damage-inducible protein DinB
MTEAHHLADALEGLFANADNGWFTPIPVAVDGLTAEQAATAPAARFNSVWAVVNHVRFCQDLVLHRLRGLPVDRQALGAVDDWPLPGDPPDEQAWQAACDRVVTSNRELAAFIASLTEEELDQPLAPGRAKRYQLIHGLVAHNSYHTCEIISIRHMLGLWLERT